MRKEKSKSGKVKMRNKALFIGIVAIVLAVAAIGVNANNSTEASDKVNVPDVPHKINYQGYLTDAAGNPITGGLDMTFRIYDSPIGGTQLWSETQTSVHVENGLFTAILGSVNSIPGDVFPIDGSRWLETEIEGLPLTPRKEIVSVAYAFKADKDNDWCGACTGEMYTCCLTDNVGIGTENPHAKLEVIETGKVGLRVIPENNDVVLGYGEPGPTFYTHYNLRLYKDWSGFASGVLVGGSYLGITPPTNGMTIQGKVGIGTTEPEQKLDVVGNILQDNYDNNEWAANHVIRKARGDASSPGVVLLDDDLAWFSGQGYDGGKYLSAAGILMEADGIPGDDDMPGRIVFQTTEDGTNTLKGRMVIKNDGSVGIGIDNPWANLHIQSTTDPIACLIIHDIHPAYAGIKLDCAGSSKVNIWNIGSMGPFGYDNILLINKEHSLQPNNAIRFLVGTPIIHTPQMTITQAGNVGIGTTDPLWKLHVDGDLRVEGDLFKGGTNHFIEDHPQDPAKEIVYASLEGPEAGTYIRGTAQLVNGEAVINLPEHFSLVTSDEGLTVQLTPAGEWLQLYVVKKSTQRIIIHEVNDKNGQFDYLVQGVRKGYENHQVIRDKE
jgi:hypothetical protein